MDIDPLQENNTPRYAVESDDSDDESTPTPATPVVSISYSGASGARRVTIVIGAIGLEWLGAVTGLEQPKGTVSVDGLEERYPAPLFLLSILTLHTGWPNIRAI